MASSPDLLDRTSSHASGLTGVQTPQIVHRPPDVANLDAATAAIELADAYKICGGFPLDESQQFTLRVALGRRDDFKWAASRAADFEPRQAGKNDALAARELAGLLVFGERLQIHTAHLFPTANESFLRMVEIWENWDDLRKRVARIRWASGEQGVELLTGQRLLYRTRSAGQGRGFAKADLMVYDEAQHLAAEHVAASAPAKLANPNSQSWYCGSGGLSSSENAWRMRLGALRGNAGRLAYVEHTAELITLDEEGRPCSVRPDLLDRAAWARAYAPYGTRITDEKLLDLYDELGPETFARECLNVWDPLPGEQGELPLPVLAWEAGRDLHTQASRPVAFGIAASEDRTMAALVVAANRADGVHVEVDAHRDGVSWLVDHVVELVRLAEAKVPVAVLASSAAGSVIDPLERAGVDVVKVSRQSYAAQCGAFRDDVLAGRVFHRGELDWGPALLAVRWQQVSEGRCWRALDSASDITPLVAATLAFGALPAAQSHSGGFSDLDDYLPADDDDEWR